jgi:hypothetical protein
MRHGIHVTVRIAIENTVRVGVKSELELSFVAHVASLLEIDGRSMASLPYSNWSTTGDCPALRPSEKLPILYLWGPPSAGEFVRAALAPLMAEDHCSEPSSLR